MRSWCTQKDFVNSPVHFYSSTYRALRHAKIDVTSSGDTRQENAESDVDAKLNKFPLQSSSYRSPCRQESLSASPRLLSAYRPLLHAKIDVALSDDGRNAKPTSDPESWSSHGYFSPIVYPFIGQFSEEDDFGPGVNLSPLDVSRFRQDDF